LSELAVSYVLLGHSERRQHLGETDFMIGKKVQQAFRSGITPVLCVGETAEERSQGKTQEIVEQQLRRAFQGAEYPLASELFVAYEPRWAIGTGVAAIPNDAVAVHQSIRGWVTDILPHLRLENVRVLYGGSVDRSNAYAFLREKEIDGVLVGGASVKLTHMQEVLSAAIEAMEGEAHQQS